VADAVGVFAAWVEAEVEGGSPAGPGWAVGAGRAVGAGWAVGAGATAGPAAGVGWQALAPSTLTSTSASNTRRQAGID
jgi:hypothetical protein